MTRAWGLSAFSLFIMNTKQGELSLQLSEAQCLAILVKKHGWYWIGARLLSGRRTRGTDA